mgnify:CR=1 FL=1
MEEVKVIDLENGTFVITDEILINGIKYVYLTNENDVMDFCIRKVKIENNEEYLVKLESDQEFDTAIQAFLNKHRDELKNFN